MHDNRCMMMMMITIPLFYERCSFFFYIKINKTILHFKFIFPTYKVLNFKSNLILYAHQNCLLHSSKFFYILHSYSLFFLYFVSFIIFFGRIICVQRVQILLAPSTRRNLGVQNVLLLHARLHGSRVLQLTLREEVLRQMGI